jgi:hypothetical protein
VTETKPTLASSEHQRDSLSRDSLSQEILGNPEISNSPPHAPGSFNHVRDEHSTSGQHDDIDQRHQFSRA